jgi:hypothetical protein
MDNSKFFIWINRINSIVFLLILLCGLGFTLMNVLDGFYSHKNNKTITFDKNDNQTKSGEQIDLRLGLSSEICGTDLNYIQLETHPRSSGFSSGYNSDTKNILFAQLSTMKNWWLFSSNNQNIEEVTQLQPSGKNSLSCETGETTAIMYVISDQNTDLKSISISSTDGSDYQVISKNIDKIIESKVSPDGKFLITIEQIGDKAFLRNYSINQREKTAESPISSISTKL